MLGEDTANHVTSLKGGRRAGWSDAAETARPRSTTIHGRAPLLVVFLLVALWEAGCGARGADFAKPEETLAPSAEVSDFVVGAWQYRGPVYTEGLGYLDREWVWSFLDTPYRRADIWENVKFPGWVEGSEVFEWSLNGGECAYRFIETHTIAAFCPRGWMDARLLVQRDGSNLLVQVLDWGDGTKSMPMSFSRCRAFDAPASRTSDATIPPCAPIDG